MSAATIDKHIHSYLLKLTPIQKKAVLTVAKTFAKEQESSLEYPLILKEMDRRIEEIESGKVKGSTWNEVKLKARRTNANKQ